MDLKNRVQTRLRALNVSYECLSPIVILPAFIYTAALGRDLSILVFVAMPVLFCVVYKRYMKMQYRTRFFYVWSLWSIVFGYMLFQSTVPMMEVLPEENIIFLLLLVLTTFLFYKTKSHAFSKAYWPNAISSNATGHSDEEDTESSEKLINDSAQTENIDIEAAGERDTGNRVYQCSLCQIGIPEMDHHSVWLDCCISATNRKFFLLGCIAALFTLLLEANLSLTSICHPYLIANVFGVHILMPDDCSDVYYQYDVAVCFVTSVYCLLLAFYVLATILYQIILISRGMTAAEHKLKVVGQKQSIYQNWVNYMRN